MNPTRVLKFSKVLAMVATVGLVSLPMVTNAQKKSTKAEAGSNKGNAVLFEIGKDKFTYDEVNKEFKKKSNRHGMELNQLSCDSIKDFISLYSGYKLKIMDAESRGFDKDESIRRDLDNNRKVVSESYLYDKKIITPNLEKMAQMRLSEKKFAFMLFTYGPAPENDTLAAFRKANLAMDKLNSNNSFADVAKELSDDQYSAANGGELDEFITCGKMDRNIEEVLYKLQPGEYNKEIIKLPKFGYFIVKLLQSEKREFVKFRHILVNNTPKVGNDSTNTNQPDLALLKADSLLTLIREGSDFSTLARANSDDAASAKQGGTMDDWYSRSTGFVKMSGKVVPEFENVIFKMKDGDISDIVKTNYGYHIIRRDSTKQVDLAAEIEELKPIYRRVYLEEDKRKFIEKLKLDAGFKINELTFDKLIKAVHDTDKTNLDSNWNSNITKDLMSQTLFTIENKNYKIEQLLDEMNKPGEMRGLPVNPEGFHRAIRIFTDPIVINKATADLEQINPDFKNLIKEFRDGTLLFKVEALEVWDKMKFDSTMAREYYEKNKSDYYTTQTYDLQEILIANKKEADDLYNRIITEKLDFDTCAAKYTQRSGYRETLGKMFSINPKKHKIGEVAEKFAMKEGDISTPQENDHGYSIIKLNKINAPKMKTFSEAMQDIAPIIQTKLQKKLMSEWLEKLSTKFKLKLNINEINNLCK